MLGLTRQEVVGGDIAGIDDLLARCHLAGGQVGLNGGEHGKIRGRGRYDRHIGDEVGRIIVTGFGNMHLVARPLRLALFAVVGIRVIGGADQQRGGRQIASAGPAHRLVIRAGVELLEPDFTQGLDSRDPCSQAGPADS